MSDWATSSERLAHIFACVTEEIAASGGDGCGIVIFRATNIQEVAAAFEVWRASPERGNPHFKNWLPHRIDRSPDNVLFTDMSNENLIFTSEAVAKTQERGLGHDEIWMEVW